LRGLIESFKSMDKNGSGALSENEFKWGVRN
jgi:hypothetical protein